MKYSNLGKSRFSMPIIDVWVYSSDHSKSVKIRAILDTGAGITCIPKSAIEELGEGFAFEDVILNGISGDSRESQKCTVKMKILECEISCQIALFDRNYALIGRDILNRYRIVFDGPRANWRAEKASIRT